MQSQFVSTLDNKKEILEKVKLNLTKLKVENIEDHLERAYHSRLQDLDDILLL